MVRETTLSPANLIYPLFVAPGEGLRKEIASLPGCYHLSVDQAAREAEVVEKLGIGGVILFGLPQAKDPVGSEGYADDGVVQQAIRAIRGVCKELLVVTDVCLCEYTSHGHCGVVEQGEVQNDPTLALLARMARLPRPSGRGRGGAVGHDGRARRRHPRRARRRRLRRDADPLLRRQVRVLLLRPVPRGRRLGPAVRRPPRLPDGPGERARSAARGAARRRGGRRHRDGEAGAPVPGRDPRGARSASTGRWPPTTSRASTRW